MPRKQHKYHYIYKTTNVINEKYYIGMHSTNNLEDGYIGSGERIRRSIKKYGKENFKFEILEHYSDRNSLKQREKELVNEDLLKDKMCMNLVYGGGGGYISPEGVKKGREKCNEILKEKYGENFRSIITKNFYNNLTTEERILLSEKIKIGQKNSGFDFSKTFRGKKHTEETKRKIGLFNSINQKGEKNSQFGKPRSEETRKKIKEALLKRLGKMNGVSETEKNKLKKDEEIKKYTINGIFFNISRRKTIKNLFNINIEINPEQKILELKESLITLYVIEKKSTTTISKIFNTSDETIRNYLILFNIKRR